MDHLKPLRHSRNISKSTQRESAKRNMMKKRRKRESMDRLKKDMEDISEGQERIKEGQQEMRTKLEEMETQCHTLKEETEEIAKQSDYNQIRINLISSILKARQDNNLAQADRFTQLLREQMGKAETSKGSLF